jgi:hypothetical protein
MVRDPVEEESARKRAKISGAQFDDIVEEAFDLYRCHLDALEDDDTDDEDENKSNDEHNHLSDLVQLFESNRPIKPFQEPLSSIRSLSDMLAILASVVYSQMASVAIERYLNGDESQQPQDYIDSSLRYYPYNAACRSVAANFGRITSTLPRETITTWYQQAAQDANQVRREALDLLESDTSIDDSIKEWVELLLLQQVVGVEYNVDDDESEGHFSPSAVEGTCRFMAAMLLSRDGHHDDALQHLKSFPLTHRLHPNVWTGRQQDSSSNCQQRSSTTRAPVSFRGVLPPKLYQQMCHVFGPDANFWKESDYANQGYYSFLADLDGKVKNLIDDVVIHHLLPLTKQVLGDEAAGEICAYEWWAHSRQASLGHTLHFDTDEASLEPGETVHHPLLSSVLHLTGDETSGATVLLDQTPESTSAKLCWRSVPHPNTFMVFPGDLLHGVLPCTGESTSTDTDTPDERPWVTPPPLRSSSNRRLTFMVGFKTRRVADQRRGETLYGPCAPLPRAAEAAWVREIQQGYKDKDSKVIREPRVENIKMKELPCVSPTWECIPKNGDEGDLLELPEGMDHRFFVNGEPAECFRKSLFEHDDVP